MFGFFRRRRREQLRSQPFPPEWGAIVERNVPYYNLLSEADRQELHGHIHVFLAEKHFEGCAGLTMTDEIRLTIAAQACLLLLHRQEESDDFNRLITILVYPSAYVAHSVERIGPGAVLEGESTRLGEASLDGVVVLSWDDVQSGARGLNDGHNVVLHEFAHQLDDEDGAPDGTPRLPNHGRYLTWARVMSEEYNRLRQGKKSVIDDYGAINPAEFFAVATECFFEKPGPLRRKHPALYEELKAFYRQDPEEVLRAANSSSGSRSD